MKVFSSLFLIVNLHCLYFILDQLFFLCSVCVVICNYILFIDMIFDCGVYDCVSVRTSSVQ